MSAPSVLVVGAGPAGSTTARLLAERGARVTLVEARRLPRPKLCGGGLTPKALRLVPPGALATIERSVDTVELRGGRVPPFRLTRPAAVVAMVMRDAFDLALVEAAASAGVEVRDGVAVRDAGEDADGVWLLTDRERVRADLLVAADGEPSLIARRLGLASQPALRGLALEVDVALSAAVAPDTAVVSYSVPGGYAWYFPKRGHASLGVASARSGEAHALRGDLARFAATVGLTAEEGRVRGHWLPVGLRAGPVASRRAVLVGDAAATADPLFGEGIAYALHSAGIAAGVAGEWMAGEAPDLRAYDARLRASLGPAFGRLMWITRAVDRSASAVLLALRTSESAREFAVDVVSGRRAPFALGAA